MAGIEQIGQGGVVAQVDGTHRAGRQSLRGMDYGAFGSYSVFLSTGLVGISLAANSPVFSFRWGDSSRFCVLNRVEVSCMIAGVITTAVHMGLRLTKATGFSTSDTGGTAATLTSPNLKKKSTMAASLVTDIRIASTGTLTAGTRTLDAQGMYGVEFGTGTAAGSTPLPKTVIYSPYPGRDNEMVFGQNEGFILQNIFIGPATGSYVIGVNVDWTEVASFGSAQLG